MAFNFTTTPFEFKTQRTITPSTHSGITITDCFFDADSKIIFRQAITDFIKSVCQNSNSEQSTGQLTLVGIFDTSTGRASLHPTQPRKSNLENTFLFDISGYSQVSSNDPKLGASGLWTMRLKSHHKKGRGFNGPVSHIHALQLFTGRDQVSSDDSLNRIGFSLFIKYQAGSIVLTADGKSRSLNHDAQLLRLKYTTGHELSDREASEAALYSGKHDFSDYAKDEHMQGVLHACKKEVATYSKIKETTAHFGFTKPLAAQEHDDYQLGAERNYSNTPTI